ETDYRARGISRCARKSDWSAKEVLSLSGAIPRSRADQGHRYSSEFREIIPPFAMEQAISTGGNPLLPRSLPPRADHLSPLAEPSTWKRPQPPSHQARHQADS